MIVVEMREEHDVDVIGGQAFLGETRQQTTAAEAREAGNLEIDVAQSEIDECGTGRRPDQEGPDADGEPTVVVKIGGVPCPSVRRAVGEDLGRIQPYLPVGQVRDGRVPDADLFA
jgi:hypothetical protein